MELRRVLLNKTFLAVQAALVLLNCFFFIYQQSDGQGDFRAYGDAYHRKVQELSALSWEEGLDRCIKLQDDALELMLADQWEYSAENNRDLRVAEQLESQYAYLLGYEAYLDKIDADVEKLQAVSLFSDPDSPAYQNTVKTAADFGAMRGVELTPGHDLAVTSFFQDKWADYSVLILMCVVCGLFMAERKEGLWPMIYAAPGGRRRLACKRVGLLFTAAWLAAVLIVGTKILLCGWVFHGLGEWDRVLQSIPMFRNVPTPMTIGEFWLLYLTVKALGAFWIGLVLWAVLSSIANLGLALGAAGLFWGVEFACTAIASSSMFAPLRYVNVFSYVDFGTVFTRYLNISVFGGLVSGSDLVLAILPFLCVSFAAWNLAIARRKHPVAPVNRLLRWADGIQKKLDPKLAGGGEFCKLLIRRKGVLLLILLAFVLYQKAEPPRKYVPYDPYVQHYQARFAGPITDDTIQSIEAELAKPLDTGNSVGLRTVQLFAQDAPEGSWIVPTAPYDAIWSDNLNNYHRATAMTALLFLVLLLAPIASQEPHNDMTILLRSTPGGRRRLLWHKQIVLLAVTAAVWAGVYGAELFKTVQYHGAFQCLAAPAYSLEQFRDTGWTLPLGWLMACYYFAKLVVLLAAGEVSFLLSGRCTKNRDAMLLCCGVLLIPAALAAIGSDIGEALSLLLPLGGVELMLP